MFQSLRFRGGPVLLTIAFAAVLSPLAAQAAEVEPAVVRSYQEDFGVSAATAEANLAAQERGASIVGQLQVALGADYAGVWFDNEAGEFVVPVLDARSRGLAEATLRRLGLDGDFRLTAAQSSWAELLAAHAKLDRGLRGPLAAGEVSTSVDPRANAVVVDQAEDLGQATEDAIEEKLEGAGVEVELDREQASSLFGSTTACSEAHPTSCDLPGRGGVAIAIEESNQYNCTAGFPATSNVGGHKLLVTAGHCLVQSFNWKTWDAGKTPHRIGHTEAFSFSGGNDYGSINVDGDWWSGGAWKYQILNWGVSQEYAINSEAWSYVGQTVCSIGANRGKECGPVTEVDVTYTDPETTIAHTSKFGPVCIDSGDSGAPVFNGGGHAALGIVSADNSLKGVPPVCQRYSYFTEITRDADALGVRVAPVREGGAPTATSGAVGNVQANQATATGSVNPNLVPTKYSFQYGQTTAYGLSAPSPAGDAGHGAGMVGVSAVLPNLKGSTTYHYRVVASSAAGTSYGSDVSFTTPASPPPIQAEDDDFPGPHAVVQANGTIDVFYRTPSGQLGHNWLGTGGGWASATLPASIAAGSVPQPIVQANGTIDVFYRTTSGGLGHNWYDIGGAGWLSGNLPGSLAGDPHAVVQANGTIDVFFRTPGGGLGHDWFDTGGAGWLAGSLPGSVAGDPYPTVQANGTVDVFYRTPSGQLGHNWYDTGGAGWLSGNLPGPLASDPRPIVQANGTLDVFFRTTSGGLGHDWIGIGGGWASGNLPGSVASDPHVTAKANGTIDVFYRTPSGELGHDWYDTGGAGWLSGNLPGSVAGDPYPTVQNNGTIDVFYRTPSGELGHTWFDAGGAGWFSGNLPGPVNSVPHAVAQSDGTVDVFFRTNTGALGHDWFAPCCGGWFAANLAGSVALEPPAATTGAAGPVGLNEATVTGTVNPEGAATTYYFEYGVTTGYGVRRPATPASAGSGNSPVAVSYTLTGLQEGTTNHYRLVATSSEGTTYGADKTFTTQGVTTAGRLGALAVTEPFDGTATSLANFGSKWSQLGWASGKGEDATNGWHPGPAFPTVNGASYGTTVADAGSGGAAVATLAVDPGIAERYFSLWLDMPTPTGVKAGYELRFTSTGSATFKVAIAKWQSGFQTALTSISNFPLPTGTAVALVDQGSSLTAWVKPASGPSFVQVLTASDSTYASGKAGLEGAGNITRLTNFKAGSL